MASTPGPIRIAMFSDVPYILDSIWRWAEFRAFRLGRVSLTGQHRFRILATTPWPFFVAYAVISSLVVFGPTFTTLCVGLGARFAEAARVSTAIALLALSAVLLGLLVAEISPRLVRRAADQLGIEGPSLLEKEGDDEGERGPNPLATLTRAFVEEITHPQRLTGRIVAALLRMPRQAWAAVRAIGALGKPTRRRFWVAFLFLLLTAGIVIVPFVAAGVTLLHTHYDQAECGARHDAWRTAAQIVFFCVLLGWGILLWQWRDAPAARRQLILVTAAWVFTTLVLWYGVAAEGAREATGGPYHQTFSLLLGCLLAVTFFARRLAQALMSSVSSTTSTDLQKAMATTQLFDASRVRPDVGRMRLFAALINGIFYHPLHLLLLPSLVAVMLPTEFLIPGAGAFLALAVLMLMHGSVAQRWEELVLVVQRWFLRGTPLLVSLGVIALALARLWDVQYVTTILDAAPVGVISALILAAYASLWFFEYWINRWIAERLLAVLGAADQGRCGYVSYPFPGSPSTKTTISPLGRVIALQGIGEFCVQGWFNRVLLSGATRRQHAFTTYQLVELFEQLAPGTEAAHEIARRVRAYFATVNLVLIGLAAALLTWQYFWDRPLSADEVIKVASAAAPASDSGDLAQLLGRQAARHRPALIVAASGGGTRAALYTATALEGLARLDPLENLTADVVLLSGVSGGGVASAYFAVARDKLTSPYAISAPAWSDFKRRITEPFIEDVLDGVDELRVAADAPLGELLAESLQRRVFESNTTFRDLHGTGLILNATISGHPWSDSALLKEHVGVPPAGDTCIARAQPFAALAGSRIIFTNLQNVGGFQPLNSPMVMPDVGLGYKVIRDPSVPLASAAALNANFPPVFSNARVRTDEKIGDCPGSSYYVTDGGATENLGLVSALYALRNTLESWNSPDSGRSGPALPEIHVIAVEASAVTYDYTEDRGIGAATGGSKERINGALTAELVHSINLRLAELGAAPLHLHYLPLPVAFRSRGGFGTHWMYAKTIRVSNPLVPKLGNRAVQWWHQHRGLPSYAFLKQADVNAIWSALFETRPFCQHTNEIPAQTRQVADWLCGRSPQWQITAERDLQIDGWACLVEDLRRPLSSNEPMDCRAH